jgi:hypothetical protein
MTRSSLITRLAALERRVPPPAQDDRYAQLREEFLAALPSEMKDAMLDAIDSGRNFVFAELPQAIQERYFTVLATFKQAHPELEEVTTS